MTISTRWKVEKTFCDCSRCFDQPNGIDFKGYLVSSDLTCSTAHACHMLPWRWVSFSIRGYKENLQNCCWYFKKLSWKWIPDLKMNTLNEKNTWLDNEYLTLIFLWMLACEVDKVTMDEGLQNYFIYMTWQSSRFFFCDVWIETYQNNVLSSIWWVPQTFHMGQRLHPQSLLSPPKADPPYQLRKKMTKHRQKLLQ